MPGEHAKFGFSIKPSKHYEKGMSTTTFSYKPNKYLFNGKVYVITNGITFSTSALVAAQLKEYGAMFFRQETGGTELGANAMLNYNLVLPSSNIVVTIPMFNVKSNLSKGEFGHGVKPNHFIEPALDNSNDHTLEELIKIVKDD